MFRTTRLLKPVFLLIVFLWAFSLAEAQEIKQAALERKDMKFFASNSINNKTPAEIFPDRKDPSVKAEDKDYVRPDRKTRFNRYLKSMFGPTALAKTVAGAGFSTWRNSPEEWGEKWNGFGRRVASGMGKNVIKQTTVYALDESFKLDSKFYRSKKKDFGSRLGSALISPFTARNENGKRVFGFPRVVGTYTANIIANETWYPSRYGYKDGLKSGTISLGLNAAFNVFKEFVFK